MILVVESSSSPVLVYQVGKVGSSSIAASLRHAGLTVHQVHRLNPDNIARVKREHLLRGWPTPEADLQTEHLYPQFSRPQVPLRVITLVREPIGRNISYYFQNLDKIWNQKDAHHKVPMEKLVRAFQVDYRYSDDPLHWFDYEFRPTLEIDVYRYPFNHRLGSQVISSGKHEVLILRTDLDDAAKAAAIKRFLNIPALPIVSANVTEQKDQRNAYKAFLSTIRMVPEYVEFMLDSKFSRHFFDGETLSNLKRRYLNGGSIIPDDFIRRWSSPVLTSRAA